jgi:hypothetical protein
MIEAMKQALEALEMLLSLDTHDEMRLLETDIAPKAIDSLRQAIGQVEKQEPVAWFVEGSTYQSYDVALKMNGGVKQGVMPLYTHPYTTDIVVDTTNKTVGISTAGGVTARTLYLWLKKEWVTNENYVKYHFPMRAFTPEHFEFINGWLPANNATCKLIQAEEWMGLTDEEINEAQEVAYRSLRRHEMSARGQLIMPADSVDWHFARAVEAKLKEKNHG